MFVYSKYSYIFDKEITTKKTEIMTTQDYNNKANELNSKFSNLKAEVVKNWDGSRLEIKVCNSDKAKTLKEMYRNFNFTF